MVNGVGVGVVGRSGWGEEGRGGWCVCVGGRSGVVVGVVWSDSVWFVVVLCGAFSSVSPPFVVSCLLFHASSLLNHPFRSPCPSSLSCSTRRTSQSSLEHRVFLELLVCWSVDVVWGVHHDVKDQQFGGDGG